jgi:uncharacterized membrane protein YvbJ
MVKYCPNCGHPNYDSNEICINCGFNFKVAPFVRENVKKIEKEKLGQFSRKDYVAIAMSIILIVIILLLYSK